MNNDLTDARLDADIGRFLEMRADDVAAVRDASAMARAIALRTAPSSTDRATTVRLALVLAAIGLLALVAAAAVFIGGQRHPDLPLAVRNGWIAFAFKSTSRGAASDIYVVREGLEERRVVGFDRARIRAVCPSFSVDGSRLAYIESHYPTSSPGVPSDRFVVITSLDERGSPTRSDIRISTISEVNGDECQRWSPDGQRIAYIDGDPPELWVADVNGGTRKVAAWPVVPYAKLTWSPDGTTVAAADDSGIWLVPVTGAEPRLLLAPGPDVLFSDATWSPDGDQIAVQAEGSSTDSDGIRSRSSSVRLIRIDDPRQQIELAPGRLATWSPDGRRIAYETDNAIVTAFPDGTDVRPVFDDDGAAALIWSPDGTKLLFVGGVAGDDTLRALMSASVTGPTAPTELFRTNTGFYIDPSQDISWQPAFP